MLSTPRWLYSGWLQSSLLFSFEAVCMRAPVCSSGVNEAAGSLKAHSYSPKILELLLPRGLRETNKGL